MCIFASNVKPAFQTESNHSSRAPEFPWLKLPGQFSRIVEERSLQTDTGGPLMPRNGQCFALLSHWLPHEGGLSLQACSVYRISQS
jgi:hypothetical protein